MIRDLEIDSNLYWGLDEQTWNKPPVTAVFWKWCISKIFNIKACFGTEAKPHQYKDVVFVFIAGISLSWGLYMLFRGNFNLFVGEVGTSQSPRWSISLLAMFSSVLSAATALSGLVLIFPILTLTLGLETEMARDYCFLLQATSMTVASVVLISEGAKIDWRAVAYCVVGSIVGFSLGSFIPIVAADQSHYMWYFTCTCFAFALTHLSFSYCRDSRVFHGIPGWNQEVLSRLPVWDGALTSRCAVVLSVESNWKGGLLFGAGLVGGVIASIVGPGVDVCLFGVLVLLFRVSERIVKSTAIVVMSGISMYGALYTPLLIRDVDSEAYNLWLVSLPGVIVLASIGAYSGLRLHRRAIIVSNCAALVTSTVLAATYVKPWRHRSSGDIALVVNAAATFAISAFFFVSLGLLGQHLLYFLDHSELHDESLSAADPPALSPPAPVAHEEGLGGAHTGWMYPQKPFLTPSKRSQVEWRLSPDQVSTSAMSDACDDVDESAELDCFDLRNTADGNITFEL